MVLARRGLREAPGRPVTSLQEAVGALPSESFRACLSRVGSIPKTITSSKELEPSRRAAYPVPVCRLRCGFPEMANTFLKT